MKKIIKEVKSAVSKAFKKELTYKERLELFSKEYKKLTQKYKIDFTIMTIDLERVYQEGGVNKLRDVDDTK